MKLNIAKTEEMPLFIGVSVVLFIDLGGFQGEQEVKLLKEGLTDYAKSLM